MKSPQPVSVAFNPLSIPKDRAKQATAATIITETPPDYPTTDVTHPEVSHVGGATWLVSVRGDNCSAGPGHPDHGTSDAGGVGAPPDPDSIVVSDDGDVIVAGSVAKTKHHQDDAQYLVIEDDDAGDPSGSGSGAGSGKLLTISGP